MTKPVITTRLDKGDPLSFTEMDDNLVNLRDATISVASDSGSLSVELNDTLTVAGGTGISTSVINSTLTVEGFSGDYNDLTNKPTIPTNNNELTNGAGYITDYTVTEGDVTQHQTALSITESQISDLGAYITGINSSDVTTALGYTPEDAANKNTANGYAGLDAGGKVAAAQLPSFVDDVIESADFSSLPGTGETGKIYITLDNNKVYRWSGSAYVEIVASPGSTDDVSEGSTNLYFTTQRARDSFSAGSGIAIANGEISATGEELTGTVTQIDDQSDPNTVNLSNYSRLQSGDEIVFSGTSVSGSGLTAGTTYYINANVGNGNFEITDQEGGMPISLTDTTEYSDFNYVAYPTGAASLGDLADVMIMTPSSGQALVYDDTSSQWQAQTITSGIQSVSEDTTPQLGGNLDVDGNSIVSTSNGNITLAPDGTGNVLLSGVEYPNSNGTDGQVLTTNGAGVASWQDAGGGGEDYAIIVSDLYSTSSTHPNDSSVGLYRISLIGNSGIASAPMGMHNTSYNYFTLPAGNYIIEANGFIQNPGAAIFYDADANTIDDYLSKTDLGDYFGVSAVEIMRNGYFVLTQQTDLYLGVQTSFTSTHSPRMTIKFTKVA